MLQDDTPWNLDWQVQPNYGMAFDDPIELPTGSVLRTYCEWDNTTDLAIDFPDEMCVFTAFIAGETSFACTEGAWIELEGGVPTAPTDTATPTGTGG